MRKLKKYKPTKFKAKDSVYNKELADYAVSFIECLCHTKGTWAGKPFELIDWQEQIIRDIGKIGTCGCSGTASVHEKQEYYAVVCVFVQERHGRIHREQAAKGKDIPDY